MKAEKKVINYVDESGNIRKKEIARQTREKDDYTALAQYSSIGYYLAIPIVLGVFGGVAIDNYFHTKPYFTLGLILLGAVASFYNLIKLVNERRPRTPHQH